MFQCSNCQFYFHAYHDRLEQTFQDKLHNLDLGSVARCLLVADFVTAVFTSRSGGQDVLDWGGGDGLLTRVLRERGVNCVWYDPFVKPQFVGDAVYQADRHVDLTVVSEVFLHLKDPVRTLQSLLLKSDVVIATAVVPPKNLDSQWWYLMPETGQHIAFYPKEALRELAMQTGSSLCSDGRFFHVFSQSKLSLSKQLRVRVRPLAYGFAYVQHGLRMIQIALGRSKSITPDDQARLISLRRHEVTE